jgi:hypothetical protein
VALATGADSRIFKNSFGHSMSNSVQPDTPPRVDETAGSQWGFAWSTTEHHANQLGGGRTWWAHFEFTRINIAPTILPKKI